MELQRIWHNWVSTHNPWLKCVLFWPVPVSIPSESFADTLRILLESIFNHFSCVCRYWETVGRTKERKQEEGKLEYSYKCMISLWIKESLCPCIIQDEHTSPSPRVRAASLLWEVCMVTSAEKEACNIIKEPGLYNWHRCSCVSHWKMLVILPVTWGWSRWG